ncbi:RDD family protein [Halomonas denitrificans]|nr:RDD family protein [Halomonas denitrificans]
MNPADHRPCSLTRRFAAIGYDGLILVGLWMIGAALVVIPSGGAVDSGQPLFQLYLLALAYAYLAGSWRIAGRTVGMGAWRIQLVSVDGTHGPSPTLGQLTTRFLVSLASLAVLGAGFWSALLRADGATWHDRASRTRLHVVD